MSPRDRILARRAKFIAAALATSGTVACAQVEEEPQPTDASTVSDAQACLSAPIDTGVDTAPVPCLDVAADTGVEDTFDAEPAPCLKVAPDSGTD